MIITRARAHALVWIVALLPAAAGVVVLRRSDLAGPGATLNWLGRLAGIAGLSLMLAAAIVSCRIPTFDRPFGGLTKLWQTHHRMAVASFLLLLAHPILLALAAAETDLDTAVATLIPPTGGGALWVGWGALFLLMVFLAPGFRFFGKPDYQRWKALHRLAAPTVALALGHTLYLARTFPWFWEAVLWLGLAVVAFTSITYRLLWVRRIARRRYRVAKVERPANNVVELSLTSDGNSLSHEAGQFVYLTPFDPNLPAGRGEEHPYTLSSAPGESVLRVAIKDLGDASHAIQNITPGSEVRVEGPYGKFFPATARPAAPELWIAGGIGITPFLSRARQLAGLGASVDIVLIFCVQDEARALYLEELRELAARLAGFRLEMHYFYQRGPLDGDFLAERCGNTAKRAVYICGPAPLLPLAQRLVQAAGAHRNQITTEEFDLL